MKKLYIFLLFFSLMKAQTIEQVSIMPIENGINVELKVFGQTITTFVSSANTLSEAQITLNTCYWTSILTATSHLTNLFPISLSEEPFNYTMTINVFNSSSNVVCESQELTDFIVVHFSAPLEEPIVLSTEQFMLTQNEIKIYPNPSNGKMYIDAFFDIEKVAVYDAFGRLVHYQNEVVEKQLNLSHLAKGMYFIKVNNQAHFVKKIWVQ